MTFAIVLAYAGCVIGFSLMHESEMLIVCLVGLLLSTMLYLDEGRKKRIC